LKIIDRYILKTYLSSLLSVFTICMFIFVIQTFWLYIDELAGKGLDFFIIGKFLLYYSPKLIPLVLPLSVLLASLMTYGSLAENYEFAAMKSTGISLQRALLGLSVFHLFLGIGTFYFSNHIIPYGELKSYNLRRNLAKLEPTLAIREGIFNEIGDINIKVSRKYGDNERFLEDIIIHEYTPNSENNIVIKAERGEMKNETTDPNLKLVLYNGNRYEEVIAKKNEDRKRIPHTKVAFEQYEMNIDLSEFNNVDLEQENYTSTFKMQKINQLNENIDSLEQKFSKEQTAYSQNFSKQSSIGKAINDINNKSVTKENLPKNIFDFIVTDENWKLTRVLEESQSKLQLTLRNLNTKKNSFFAFQKFINLHKIALYEKYTLIFASLFLFLIGASLGAIIKKGGLGLPLVLSIIIFLTYHYIGLFGKNAAEDNSISPFFATWLSTFIIAPAAILLTRRASADKGFINFLNLYYPLQEKFKKLVSLKKRNKKMNKKNE